MTNKAPGLLSFVFCLWSVACGLSASAHADSLVMKVLPGGPTVVVQEWHRAPLVAIRAYVKAGSVYEFRWSGSGVSHYLEHTVFGGTSRRTREEIDRLDEELGNNANAYTSHDHTCYYMTTIPSLLPEALDVMADYLVNAALPEAEVDVQRGVILNEFRLGYDDPDREVSKLLYRTIFQKHLAGFPIIGDEDRFRALARQDVADYYRDRYRPENMVVVVVGDLDAQSMMDAVETAFNQNRSPSGMTGGSAEMSPDAQAQEPEQTELRRASEEKDVQADYLEIGFPSVSITHPDLFALDLMAVILGQGPSSRLYRTLYADMGLVQSIGAFSYTPIFPGVFEISAVLRPEDQAKVEATIFEEIEKLKAVAVSKEELQKAQTQVEQSYLFGQETVDGRGAQLGSDVLTTGDPEFSEKYVRGIRSVAPEDIQRVASRYLGLERASIVSVVPRGTSASLPTGPPPVKAAASAAEEPGPVHLIRFPNGIRVITRYDPSNPTVAVAAGFPGGVRCEDDRTSGLSNFVAQMLTRGTGSRSEEEIALAMDRLGGSLSGMSGNNSLGLQMEVLSGSFEEAMEVFADCLRHPAFPAERVERERKNLLEAIARRQDDWNQFGSDWMRQALFRSYPYRLSPAGTVDSVGHLSREALLDAYQRYANPRSLIVAVFGAVPTSQVIGLLHRLLDDWSGPPPVPVEVPQEPPHTQEIRVARERPGFTQAIVYMGWLGQSVSADDVAAVDVLDAALSGVGFPGGRLHERLRQGQLVYVVHFFPVRGPDTGYLGLYAASRPDQLSQALSAIDEELERFDREGLQPGELERARRMCLLAFASQHQTNLQQAQQAVFDEMFGLGYRYSLGYPRRIEAVTEDQVIVAAKRYLKPETRAVVTVVPAAEKGKDRAPAETSQ